MCKPRNHPRNPAHEDSGSGVVSMEAGWALDLARAKTRKMVRNCNLGPVFTVLRSRIDFEKGTQLAH